MSQRLTEGPAQRQLPFPRRALRAALDLGLATPTEAVAGGIRVRDLSQSNGVAMIETPSKRFVAKDTSAEPTTEGSARRELAIYSGANRHQELPDLTPRLVEHSEEHGLMVIEALVDGWLRFDRCDLRSRWSIDVASRLGRSLAQWYRSSMGFTDIEPVRPWLLATLDGERLAVFSQRQDVADTLDRILDDAIIRPALERVASGWRHDHVMHGDMRFANIFLHVDGSIRFVDWETSGWGDVRWDLAGIVQELHSNAIGTHVDTHEHVEAFLDGYAAVEVTEGLGDFVAARLALRAIQLTSWPDATDDHVDAHLEAARSAVAGVAGPKAMQVAS